MVRGWMTPMFNRFPKIIVALVAQAIALVLLAVGVLLMSYLVSPPYPVWLLVIIQGVLAAMISCRIGLPCWWRIIQIALPVGLYWGLTLEINPWVALAVFLVLWMVFFNAIKDRVPLYLTNSTTREALKKIVKRRRGVRFLDLGAGLGGNVTFMSQLANVSRSDGVETAPIPYLVAKFFTLVRGGHIFAMDIWNTKLEYYDVVYAFLSPEPMEKLWRKVSDEMEVGSVFVSNSFAVPDVEPTEIWELSDARQTKLYLYHIK